VVLEKDMIVQATLEQVPLAIPLLREMQCDDRTLGPVNPAHFIVQWREIIQRERGVMFLSLDDDGADGIMSGQLTRDLVTAVPVFQTNTAFVRVGHKKPAMPYLLLRRGEKWAKAHGARVMFCGALANDYRGTVGFLLNAGYIASDKAFVKGL